MHSTEPAAARWHQLPPTNEPYKTHGFNTPRCSLDDGHGMPNTSTSASYDPCMTPQTKPEHGRPVHHCNCNRLGSAAVTHKSGKPICVLTHISTRPSFLPYVLHILHHKIVSWLHHTRNSSCWLQPAVCRSAVTPCMSCSLPKCNPVFNKLRGKNGLPEYPMTSHLAKLPQLRATPM